MLGACFIYRRIRGETRMYGLMVFISCVGLSVGYTPTELLSYYSGVASRLSDAEEQGYSKEIITDCVDMRGKAGIYHIMTTVEQPACGIYFVGPLDAQVEIQFLDFDVACENEEIVGVLDGWEQNGALFPPVEDLGKTGHRYATFCGANRPKEIFLSSGNMALIQYRLPRPESKISFRVSFRENPEPCNGVAFLPDGKLALKNFGRAVNCSIAIIYPERLLFDYVHVGVSRGFDKNMFNSLAVPVKCTDSAKHDYLEVRGGPNFDINQMTVFKKMCGITTIHSGTSASIMCGATMIRLVSSGQFDNTVLISHQELPEGENLDPGTSVCPSP